MRWLDELRDSLTGTRSAYLVAMVTAFMGVVNVFSAVTPELAERLTLLEQFSPLEVRLGGRLTAALAGFALLLLARHLWRRKQVAWGLTLIILVISAISHLIKGLDFEEAALAGALALWLFVLRPHFQALSDRVSIQHGVRVVGVAWLFTLAYGVVGFYLLDRHFSVNFGFWAAVRQTIIMFTQFYDSGLEPVTSFGHYFVDSIYIIGATTTGYALLTLLQPILVRQPATPAERAKARTIVEAYGRSSLARMTLFDDKAYYFSPGGSLIAFVVKGRVALTLGDPIGPIDDARSAITGFQAQCARNDWQAAFYQVLPDYLEIYRAADLEVLPVGQEAIVDLTTFTLEGKPGKSLRPPLNHLAKLGHRAKFYRPPLPDKLLQELRDISDEWLTMVHGQEMRFATGWFDDEYIRHSAVMVVHTPEDRISAFASILPEYQFNGSSVDLMRRRRVIENNTMDLLFVSLFEWAKAQGQIAFSLGLSALAGVGEHSENPTTERALHYIYEHINRFYNFKGLHAFKGKFHPRWESRYLIYPGPASLPAVGLALVTANSGANSLLAYLRSSR